MNGYYNPNDVIHAAAMMVSVADQFTGNNNFEYDLVDIVRQGLSTFWGQPHQFLFHFFKPGQPLQRSFHLYRFRATEFFTRVIFPLSFG